MTWPANEADIPVRTVTPDDGILRYDEGIHVGYRAWLRGGAEPAFPFGAGNGYTSWEVAAVETIVLPTDASDGKIHVGVRNTGARVGSTVVQAYLERTSPSDIDRPARWLAAFETLRCEAGETATAALTLPWRRLAHWDDGWVVEPGQYRLTVGFSSVDPEAETLIVVDSTASNLQPEPASEAIARR